jgi:hypothetical protein
VYANFEFLDCSCDAHVSISGVSEIATKIFFDAPAAFHHQLRGNVLENEHTTPKL